MSNFTSTGVLQRPQNTRILKIDIKNTTQLFSFQIVYIYDWDSGSAVLVETKNFSLLPNSASSFEYPLVIGVYGDQRNINLYEVVYGPTTPGVIVTLTNI